MDSTGRTGGGDDDGKTKEKDNEHRTMRYTHLNRCTVTYYVCVAQSSS